MAVFFWRYFGIGSNSASSLINIDTSSWKKGVAFGDSLTAGQGAKSQNGTYPAQLELLTGFKIVNLGKNGDTTSSAKKRLSMVLAEKPDFVIITLGGNDLRQKIRTNETVQNLEFIFREIQSVGAGVVYLSINPPMVSSEWNAELKRVVHANGVLWVDDVMKDLWTNSDLMSDVIHPNEKGYAIIAERAYQGLQQVVDP
ncbi:MAG: GDSL-type esterase/lipase family protein [Proteobacteria bacterium]|nr:GDSL-type esterase/lipase family protein [Pseudomonadota bacterium]